MAAQRASSDCVERVAVGHEADFQESIALQRIAAFAKQLAHGPARQQADFERAGDFRDVVGVNLGGRFAVEAAQQAVQRTGAARFPRGQAVAQCLIARRALEQAIEQTRADRSRYRRRSPADVRGPRYPRSRAGQAGVFAGGEDFVRVRRYRADGAECHGARRAAIWRFRYRNSGKPAVSRNSPLRRQIQ